MSKQVNIYYRPVERHYYRVKDWVQPKWRRFADSEWGRYAGRAVYYTVRLMQFVVMVGFGLMLGIMYLFMSMAFGGKGFTGRRR